MTRAEAIHIVLEKLNNELVVVCNGFPSREAFAFRDSPKHFYMIGSMGLAPAIGAGLAFANPSHTVVVLDGDGNLLMNMGSLATIAAHQPKNLLHIVFDNEAYGSTGNQATISEKVLLDEVARSCGYVTVKKSLDQTSLLRTIDEILTAPKPGFLLVKVSRDAKNTPRVSIDPPAMTTRFRGAAKGNP